MNLCINAADALEGKGVLTISTGNVVIRESNADSNQKLCPTRFVKLQVSDNGPGMNAATLEKAFEPFFTTKEAGKGTGLGLDVVHQIVNRHSGSVSIESLPGAGTQVTVLLPTKEHLVSPEGKEKTSASKVKNGKGTVLLVDDEDILLKTGKRLLERLGYSVMLAEHGDLALDIYKTNQEEIDLVLLDMNMPVMNGSECLVKLQNIDPEVKVVFLSGMVGEQGLKALSEGRVSGFLQKPFDLVELSETVSKAIVDPALDN